MNYFKFLSVFYMDFRREQQANSNTYPIQYTHLNYMIRTIDKHVDLSPRKWK